MTKLERLNLFLQKYGTAYRTEYTVPEETAVTIPFLGNDGHVFIKVLDVEPGTAVGEYWYDGQYFRKTISVEVDNINGFLHTYQIISTYGQEFETNLQFIGVQLDLPKGVSASQFYKREKGLLKVFNGVQFDELDPGPDGTTLIVDSNERLGLKWVNPSPDLDDDLTWDGSWITRKAYTVGKVVGYVGSTYVCVSDHVSDGPPPNTDFDVFVGAAADGEDGQTGEIGTKGGAGLIWRGEYDDQKVYAENDVVLKYRSSYRSTIDGNTSDPETTDWEPVAIGQDPFVLQKEFVCAETISTYKLVIADDQGNLVPANHHNPNHAYRLVGVTTASGGTNDSVLVTIQGYMSNASWAFTPGSPIFAGVAGELTMIVPTDGFACVVGRAISATEILFTQMVPTLL